MPIALIPVNLKSPPPQLRVAIDNARREIETGTQGPNQLPRDKFKIAVRDSRTLPTDVIWKTTGYLNADRQQLDPTQAFYRTNVNPDTGSFPVSHCGGKKFHLFGTTNFSSANWNDSIQGDTTAIDADLLIGVSPFHVHGNDQGRLFDGITPEHYEFKDSGHEGFAMFGGRIYRVSTTGSDQTAVFNIACGLPHGVMGDAGQSLFQTLRFGGPGGPGLALVGSKWRDEKSFGWAPEMMDLLLKDAAKVGGDSIEEIPLYRVMELSHELARVHNSAPDTFYIPPQEIKI